MSRFGRYANAAKVVALCLPPVIMSLAGLAALSRKPARRVGRNEAAARRGEVAASGVTGRERNKARL